MAGPANTQFALAVHMLTLLGVEPEVMQRSESLAASANASPVHVRRVLGRLRRAGLVTSRNGPNGGWLASKATDDVRLDDVWHALHGDEPVLGLYDANPSCPVGQGVQQALEDLDRRAARALTDELGRTTIGDLVERTRAQPPAQALTA